MYGFVVVFLYLSFVDRWIGDFEMVMEVMKSFVVFRVDVELFRGYFKFDCLIFINCIIEICFYDVVVFGVLGDIVCVVECVDL